jgi:hypothetical protein
MSEFLLVTAAGAALWSLLCRIRSMTVRRTHATVIAQHAVLAAAIFVAVVATVPDWGALRAAGAHGWVVDTLSAPRFGVLVLCLGVAFNLLAGAPAWRRHLRHPATAVDARR